MKPKLILKNCLGVSRIGDDSKLLAAHSVRQRGKSALDVGCGTGIVAINLQAKGWNCVGVDISDVAVECAKKNAKLNGISQLFKKSNLFENVGGKFDLIVFNPPYGNTTRFSGLLEFVKCLLPRGNSLLSKITYVLIKEKRRQFIKTFLNQASKYLNENGKIMMVLHKSETQIFKSWKIKILDKCGDCRIVIMEAL